MRITLDALLVLDAIDRGGSFAAAAEALLRVPSAVSYTVQKLEQDLGTAVFDRSGHRAKLTAAGTQLLKDGRELLRLAEQIEQKVREIGAGWEAHLSIAVGALIPLGPIYSLLRTFYDTPGHSATHLKVTTESPSACWSLLLAGKSDLVIGVADRLAVTDDVRTRVLGEVELTLAVPPSHPLADASEPVAAHAIARHRVIHMAESPFGEMLDDMSSDSVTVDDYASQVEAIRHGLGVGYVPAYLVRDDVAASRLVAKAVVDAPRMRLVVAWRRSGVGNGLQWFLDRLDDESIQARLIPDRHPSSADDLRVIDAIHPRASRAVVGHEAWGSNELEIQTPR
jgi:DNA-binding transcriptional LysR family regulator